VRLLVAKGGAATVNVKEQQHGLRPLHLALSTSQQSAELVNLLIESGADVNAKTNNKVTPLMLAQELPVLRLLLGVGAAVNAKTTDGKTALHSAAELGLSAAVVRCLLKAGADATAADSEGHEPAAVAVKNGHIATAALLQRAAADQRLKQQQQLCQVSVPVSGSCCSSDANSDSNVHSDRNQSTICEANKLMSAVIETTPGAVVLEHTALLEAALPTEPVGCWRSTEEIPQRTAVHEMFVTHLQHCAAEIHPACIEAVVHAIAV
jgi:ankyrin repeat protein